MPPVPGSLLPFADSVAGVEKSEPPSYHTDSGTEGHAELLGTRMPRTIGRTSRG